MTAANAERQQADYLTVFDVTMLRLLLVDHGVLFITTKQFLQLHLFTSFATVLHRIYHSVWK